MKTILYLDNRYCQSLADLRKIVEKAELHTPLFVEIRSAFFNDAIGKWLDEGSAEEKELAAKVRAVSRKLMDNELLERLKEVLANKKIKIEKPRYTKFAKLNAVRCWVGGNYETVKPGKDVPLGKFDGDVEINLDFEILESANYSYEVELALKSELASETERMQKQLNLKTQEKTCTVSFSVPSSDFGNFCTVMLLIEGETVQSFSMVRRPVPNFSPDCTEEQRTIIQDIINRMVYVDSGEGSYCIFDGEPHNVRLSGYYISPIIKKREYWECSNDPMIALSRNALKGVSFFNDIAYYDGDFEAIDKFIETVSRLSGLKFSLPSEAQWERAACERKIKFGGYEEWTRDDYDYSKSTTPGDTIDPVCSCSSGKHAVRGRMSDNPKWRSPDSGKARECFRIVWQYGE